MEKKIFLQFVCLLMTFTFVIPTANAQNASGKTWNLQRATKWFQQGEWQKDLALKADPSTDKVAFATQYHENKKAWDEAFDFLRSHNLDTMAAGKYAIDDENVFATITIGPSKPFDKTNWESHRNYVDLQYVISGKEKIGVAPVATATVTTPYDVSKDIANYSAEGKYHIAVPGTFFLFFPTDAHRPSIKVKGNDVVKKLVIKIHVAE